MKKAKSGGGGGGGGKGGKAKGEKDNGELKTCTHVKARHIFAEKVNFNNANYGIFFCNTYYVPSNLKFLRLRSG